jgi:hypothetical protein
MVGLISVVLHKVDFFLYQNHNRWMIICYFGMPLLSVYYYYYFFTYFTPWSESIIINIINGVRPDLVHLARRPQVFLLYQPRLIMMMMMMMMVMMVMMCVAKWVEWKLADETEVLGKSFPSTTWYTTSPTRPDLESNPGSGY